MKKYLISLSILFFLLGCTKEEPPVYLFSFFQNNGEDGLHLAYSYDAFNWQALNNNQSYLKPAVGGDKLMRDPCIIKGGDGKFHMVWTVSWNERGIGYANSEDLINWSAQKYIPVMEHEPDAINCWAPELYYDATTKTYLIYWSTTIPGRFPETAGSGDNKYNHRMYFTTTKDFEEFSPTTLLYDHGFNVIDGTIQKIKGEYVMFLKNETKLPQAEKNIRIATSKQLTGPYTNATEPITDNWVEGPTAVKTPKGWLVLYDQYTRHKMGAVLAKEFSINPKDWQDVSEQINFPEGTRHGTVIKVEKSVLENLLNNEKE
jgi:beta-xylosidase